MCIQALRRAVIRQGAWGWALRPGTSGRKPDLRLAPVLPRDSELMSGRHPSLRTRSSLWPQLPWLRAPGPASVGISQNQPLGNLRSPCVIGEPCPLPPSLAKEFASQTGHTGPNFARTSINVSAEQLMGLDRWLGHSKQLPVGNVAGESVVSAA